jgi:predicted ATP-grasp superfamily ATP-dependent carboligase
MVDPPTPGTVGSRLSSRVLVAGVSTRAIAESAARAGFAVTALDAFGDLDQHPSVRSLPALRDSGGLLKAGDAARAARHVECDAVAYVSNFENYPKAVATLADGRTLWGNGPAVLRRVRDPALVTRLLRRHGCDAPEVRPAAASDRILAAGDIPMAHESQRGRWLVKSRASGGGCGVRPWNRATLVPRGCYLQELVEGTPGSIVFVAAGGRAVPLGVSRQLVGDPAFGAGGYRYCGNILEATGAASDTALVDRTCDLARAVAEEFGVVGVNGIDFIARQGRPYAIEVNPRWCASMELVERAYEFSVFGAHAAACADGVLPAFDLRRPVPQRTLGKAVVFARRAVTVGDTRGWLADASVRDVPRSGERISAGKPVCTVFAAGRDPAACYAELVRRAGRVYGEIAGWTEA